ncbi:hypothetical protein [Streptomyces mirabilis]|uniref:hypothetical protein n=1 Tax=Streptomyces mirabilis TaxID=68239 RepID=UPI0036AC7C56
MSVLHRQGNSTAGLAVDEPGDGAAKAAQGNGAVGVVCADDGPEFIALQEQVWETLKKDPRKEPEMARHNGRALCDGCTVHI